jgi:hypothetical protein
MEDDMLQVATDARYVTVFAGRLFLAEHTLPAKKAVRAEGGREKDTARGLGPNSAVAGRPVFPQTQDREHVGRVV